MVTGHLLSCIWNLRVFPDDATGVSVPLRVVASSSGLHLKRCSSSGIILSGRGNGCLSESGMTHEASFQVSRRDRPPPEVRQEGRDPFPDKAGESTLMSRSRGEKGLRFSGARILGVPLE